MPFADTSLRDEYAAAVERVAGLVLDALRGGGGPAAPARPDGAAPPSGAALPGGPGPTGEPALTGDPRDPALTGEPQDPALTGEPSPTRAELAAIRILGLDAFAPGLLDGLTPDATTALVVAQALDMFPSSGTTATAAATGTGTRPEAAFVTAWRDRATAQWADSLVPRDTDPITEDPEQLLTDHGHTAVVTVVAAAAALARALGGASVAA
ncbi:hypothetical protein [Streptomyces sp. CB01881]|uniref:hypothetical protein n=1 Tax=Streptomyces sp. CB01881 TaxID=2078691 RepID=UPI001F1221A8|nr:hypothetical protein [Streptomyces sp. CB01881]